MPSDVPLDLAVSRDLYDDLSHGFPVLLEGRHEGRGKQSAKGETIRPSERVKDQVAFRQNWTVVALADIAAQMDTDQQVNYSPLKRGGL